MEPNPSAILPSRPPQLPPFSWSSPPYLGSSSHDENNDFRGQQIERQPQVERHDSNEGDTLKPTSRRGSYKPTSLRWPFLVVQIVLLVTAVVVLALLMRTMPDSDDTAVVDGRPMGRLVQRIDRNWAGYELHDTIHKRSGESDEPTTASSTVGDVSSPGRQAPDPVALGPTTTTSPQAKKYSFKTLDRGKIPSATTSATEIVPVLTTISTQPAPAPTSETRGGTTAPPTFDYSPVGEPFRPSSVELADPVLSLDPKISMLAPNEYVTSDGSGLVTVTLDLNDLSGISTTDPIVRWSSDFVKINNLPTTLHIAQEGTTTLAASPPDITATSQFLAQPAVDLSESSQPLPVPVPAVKTIDTIVSATTTTIVITGSPQTSFNSIGSPVTYSPTQQTIVAVFGGFTTKSVVIDDGLAAVTQTIITSAGGVPITLLAITTPGAALTETLVSVVAGTEVTVTPPPVTFVTDLGGGLLVITTSTPPPYVTTTGGVTSTMTHVTTPGRIVTSDVLTTINGTPTTVPITLTVTPTPSTRMVIPTATNVSQGSAGDRNGTNGRTASGPRVIPGVTAAQYFAGTFLPTIVAVALAVPISVIDLNAKLFQPFRALSRPEGAEGPDAMTLHFNGVHAVIAPVTQLVRGEPVPAVTTLLLWLSWLLAPLASEAIGFKVHGTCSHLSISGCAIALGVSPAPASALIAVIAVMLALLATLAVLLRRWDTGLHSNPWSIAGMASLVLDSRLRDMLAKTGEPTEAELAALFDKDRFRLENFASRSCEADKRDDYGDRGCSPCSTNSSRDGMRSKNYDFGIVPLWDEGKDARYHSDSNLAARGKSHTSTEPSSRRIPFLTLSYTWRLVFMALLLGVMAMIIYYHLLREDNGFELFMDSQTFGVRFLFAALGCVIACFWSSFFLSVTIVAPFMIMKRRARRAERSILPARPTNAFRGVYVAAVQQHDMLVLVTAATAVVSEFLPILLSNVPYALTQTLEVHNACTYGSLIIMATMVLVLAASMLVSWPHMPVDPRTVAGAAYYVAGGALLCDTAGCSLSTLDKPERDKVVSELEHRYFYGRVVSSSGTARMVVDKLDDTRV